jgi:hypothetical protein
MELVINANYINHPLALVAPEDGQLRPNHVGLKDHILVNKLNAPVANFVFILNLTVRD